MQPLLVHPALLFASLHLELYLRRPMKLVFAIIGFASPLRRSSLLLFAFVGFDPRDRNKGSVDPVNIDHNNRNPGSPMIAMCKWVAVIFSFHRFQLHFFHIFPRSIEIV